MLTCEPPGGLTTKREHKNQRAKRKAMLKKHDIPHAAPGESKSGDKKDVASPPWATDLRVRWFARKCESAGENGVNIVYGILPPGLFQTGDVVYSDSLRKEGALTHANFMKGNERKLPFLRKLGLWCEVPSGSVVQGEKRLGVCSGRR